MNEVLDGGALVECGNSEKFGGVDGMRLLVILAVLAMVVSALVSTVPTAAAAEAHLSSSGTQPTTVAVSSTVNPAFYGQSTTISAVASVGGSPSSALAGTMSFLDGTTLLGTKAVVRGRATLATATLTAGDHSITAVFTPGTADAPTTSTVYVQHVDQAATTTSMSAPSATSVYGQSVGFKALVRVVSPSTGLVSEGTVTFYDRGAIVATLPVVNGVASVSVGTLRRNNAPVFSAFYNGTPNHGSATSASVAEVINPANTTVTVVSSHPTAVTGQAITYTATVKPVAPGTGIPTGTVTITDGVTVLATGVPLDATGRMQGTFNIVAVGASIHNGLFSVGTHPITVTYDGSGDYEPATSTILNQTVNPASTAITMTASPGYAVTGQPITFTTTVKPSGSGSGTPTGTVIIFDSGVPIATVDLVNGVAIYTTSSLTLGTHSLTVTYSDPSGQYKVSKLPIRMETIHRPPIV